MGRKQSARVTAICEELITRLREGVYRPGERFLSARELAAQFAVSYQTADRILDTLGKEGYVERRAASGTYIPSSSIAFAEVGLFLSLRARRPQSFGERLLAGLTERLRRADLSWSVHWAETAEEVPPSVFPVLWEAPAILETCLRQRRPALLLNARPAPGLDSAFLDSVSVDDFFGGACAADLLIGQKESSEGLAVVIGPEDDPRSEARKRGFLSRATSAAILSAGGWYKEDGFRIALEALRLGPHGIFCTNDRLAEALLLVAERNNLPRPRLVGFDDAPIAALLNLTTIAIPWDELIGDAVEITSRRLAGDVSAARRRMVTPRPVIRLL